MRLITTLFKQYPTQSILALLAMLFAGLAEGLGLSMLLPLLSLALTSNDIPGTDVSQSESTLEQIVGGFFDTFGAQPSDHWIQKAESPGTGTRQGGDFLVRHTLTPAG